jgi:Chromo (CHRromatin Organisation MOdifier) domain
VKQVINPVVFKLELPEQWKQKRLHPGFHASLLSPYKEMEEHGPNFLEPPPDVIEGEEEYEVEQVFDSQCSGRNKQLQYLLKWKGYSEAHNSWEPANQVYATELIKEYYKQKPAAVKGIKRVVIKPSVNMSQPTPSFTLGYTWDQLHSATVDLNNHQRKATLEVEAFFFDPTKEHRRLGQPNSITYEQVQLKSLGIPHNWPVGKEAYYYHPALKAHDEPIRLCLECLHDFEWQQRYPGVQRRDRIHTDGKITMVCSTIGDLAQLPSPGITYVINEDGSQRFHPDIFHAPRAPVDELTQTDGSTSTYQPESATR